jgi:hypothetical protein
MIVRILKRPYWVRTFKSELDIAINVLVKQLNIKDDIIMSFRKCSDFGGHIWFGAGESEYNNEKKCHLIEINNKQKSFKLLLKIIAHELYHCRQEERCLQKYSEVNAYNFEQTGLKLVSTYCKNIYEMIELHD